MQRSTPAATFFVQAAGWSHAPSCLLPNLVARAACYTLSQIAQEASTDIMSSKALCQPHVACYTARTWPLVQQTHCSPTHSHM